MTDIIDFIRPTNAFELAAFAKNHHDTYPFIEPMGTELSGKSILITGASKGIGLATAVRCAKAGCAQIAVAARSSLESVVKEIKDEAAKCGVELPHILPLSMDVTSDESVKAASLKLEAAFGGEVRHPRKQRRTVIESDPIEWWKAWEVNVKGTFLCCHYFLPFVLSSDTKIVVNLSSVGAHTLSYGASSYQTSRFANVRLNEFLARDHEDEKLIAISLHPGGVKTDMAANFPEVLHFSLADELALPADTIIWLAKERRDWLNGRFVWSNWDLEEVEGKKDEIIEKDLFKFRMTG
ncbi:Glucose/ribitol dehydrogenase [Penicillium cosmopolitanum]|uniref:Glucose/ribitol dehydrogenase n=1 Tax=Penicillium cosmopolitanum TaxID=1131564 RepID=A0A9W9SE29_9EURO|nr:Glucose/ribitol dehydrogenase [Penicillium cosmopolitanum]KAJ5376927.1 Glucose/ribitol dehydrogenase [Penicillium cosmopolitanum]